MKLLKTKAAAALTALSLLAVSLPTQSYAAPEFRDYIGSAQQWALDDLRAHGFERARRVKKNGFTWVLWWDGDLCVGLHFENYLVSDLATFNDGACLKGY